MSGGQQGVAVGHLELQIGGGWRPTDPAQGGPGDVAWGTEERGAYYHCVVNWLMTVTHG